jgi:hypothetical protein
LVDHQRWGVNYDGTKCDNVDHIKHNSYVADLTIESFLEVFKTSAMEWSLLSVLEFFKQALTTWVSVHKKPEQRRILKSEESRVVQILKSSIMFHAYKPPLEEQPELSMMYCCKKNS